jgi:hypothetical protein
MPKLKGKGNKFELVRTLSGPCTEWLEVIETMCNKILGNYMKKEDQLMVAAFDT